MLRLYNVALYCTGFLCCVVKVEGALCLGVVVAPVAQRVVRADEDLGAAAGELGCGELLLVVLLVCRGELCLYVVVADDLLDRLGHVRKLRRVSIAVRGWGVRGSLPRQEAQTRRRSQVLMIWTLCVLGVLERLWRCAVGMQWELFARCLGLLVAGS